MKFCLNNRTSPFVLLAQPVVVTFFIFLSTLTALIHSTYSCSGVPTLCHALNGVRKREDDEQAPQTRLLTALSLHPCGRADTVEEQTITGPSTREDESMIATGTRRLHLGLTVQGRAAAGGGGLF